MASGLCPCCEAALQSVNMYRVEGKFSEFPFESVDEGDFDTGIEYLRNGSKAVDFDDVMVNESQVEIIIQELRKPSCELEALSLYGSSMSRDVAEKLAEVLLYDSSLKFLNLSGYPLPIQALRGDQGRIKDDGPAENEDSEERSVYTGVDLSEEKFTLFDTIVIGRLFQENNHILKIDLSSSYIGDENVAPIATSLAKNTSVLTLNLSSNIIGSVGAMTISEALRENTALTEIYLDNNSIPIDGATAIAAMLAVNKTLLRLHVRKNEFGTEGAGVLLAALETNRTIESFSCDHINDSDLLSSGFSPSAKTDDVIEPSIKT